MAKSFLITILFFLAAFGELFAQAPVINSFSPASAPGGTTVTITGSNFNASAASNIVLFGGVQGSVTSASVNSLQVVVPAAATCKPISVVNLANNLTGYSATSFVPTFISKNYVTANDFNAPVTLLKSRGLTGLSYADIDGDGKLDMVLSGYNGKYDVVSIYRNISAGGTLGPSSFAPNVDFDTTEGGPGKIIIQDLNGDGKPDILELNSYGDLTCLANFNVPGTISHASFVENSVGLSRGGPVDFALADIDGDGKPDIVAAFTSDPEYPLSFVVCRNISTSSQVKFDTPIPYVTSTSSRLVSLGDVDGDGKPDVIVVNSDNSVYMYQNNSTAGQISLGSKIVLAPFHSAIVSKVQLADMDGDGKPDLIFTYLNGDVATNLISVYRNVASSGPLSAASFAAPKNFAAGEGTSDIVIADMDGDGKPDLVCVDASISIMLNNSTAGNISFPARCSLHGSAFTLGNPLNVGDLDGDGKPDLMTVDANDNVIVYQYNFQPATALPPAPVISSFTPKTDTLGGNIVVNGSNFNANAASNTVYLGTTRGKVLSGNTTQLTVQVTPGSTFNPLSVLNSSNNLAAFSTNPYVNTFKSDAIIDTGAFKGVQGSFGQGEWDPNGLAIGDIDGDGKPDVVVGTSPQNNYAMSVFLNTSTKPGSFSFNISNYDAPGIATQVLLADLDGDGKLDIILCFAVQGVANTPNFAIFRNTSVPGSISFAPIINLTLSAQYIVVGDFDGDGKIDIAGTAGDSMIRIFPNTSVPGNISFAPQILIGDNNAQGEIAACDLDGDNKPELIIVNGTTSVVSVFHNISAKHGIGFEANVDFAIGGGMSLVKTADLDGDGKPDIITSPYQTGIAAASGYTNISVLNNSSTPGNISFGAHANFAAGAGISDFSVADINGDGKPDITTVNNQVNRASAIQNTSASGHISFSAKADFSVGAGPDFVGVADFDGDGKPDVALTYNWSDTYNYQYGLQVLRNNIPIVPIPAITASGALSFAVGDSVLLSAYPGAGFTYQWTLNGVNISGATKPTLSVKQSGSYTVTITGSSISKTSAATITTAVPIPVPTITANGPLTFQSGNSVLLTANPATGYTYQWALNGTSISGATNATYTTSKSGSYTVSITTQKVTKTSAAASVNVIFALQPTNFKLTATSLTCRGNNDGSVSITAVQNLNYTATITGNGVNKPYAFTASVNINNLAAGTYNVCITVAGQSGYSNCYDVVISQPQDLSVYSTINQNNSITLALSGGDQYNIQLNGDLYTTTNNSITLPLVDGNNNISVTTDRLCQGTFNKLINISGKITPYPDPFQNTLNINLGNGIVNHVSIEIHNVTNGKLIYSKKCVNQSGVLQLDVSALDNGVYVLHLSMDSQEKIFKIIKK